MRPKGVADGRAVNIPRLPLIRLTMGGRRRLNESSDGYLLRSSQGVLGRQIHPRVITEGGRDRETEQSHDATLPGKTSKENQGTRTVNGHT